MKKYELTNETMEFPDNIIFYRIRALRDFGDVKKGDLGGYIEKEDNLSHDGDCWVYGNATVIGDARVYENARIFGNADIHGNARVYGNAQVHGYTDVFGNARVYGNAEVYGDADVYGDALVCGCADVSGNARVCGNAQVFDDILVSGNDRIFKTNQDIQREQNSFRDKIQGVNKKANELEKLKKDQDKLKELLESSLVYMRTKEVDAEYVKLRDKLDRCFQILAEE